MVFKPMLLQTTVLPTLKKVKQENQTWQHRAGTQGRDLIRRMS
jgi:hypothetical protein